MTKRSRASAEWVTFGASLAVLGAIVAVIIALWVRGEDPAQVAVHQDGVRTASNGTYLVDASVTNEGDVTAANVQVMATLTIGDTTEEAEQVVDFVAGGEEEALVFVFQDDPAEGELELVVASFADP